jgi:nucleotide-binding universal stress UspA family protein
MEVIMRILCATDLLARSEAATERAARLARQLHAELTLLHVVSTDDSRQVLEHALHDAWVRARLRARTLRTRSGRAADVIVSVGNPARIILETAARMHPGLLVLGPHHKRPLRDALEGTIAAKALATRRYPVLVVRNPARHGYRQALLALDLSDASAAAVRATESLVLDTDVVAVAAYADIPPQVDMMHYSRSGSDARYRREWDRDAARTIRDLLDYESGDSGRYHIHIEQKAATPGILQAIERFAPDLVVMGTHGGGVLRRMLIGSVANRVLHQTSCDALIVPEGSCGKPRSKLVHGVRQPTNAMTACRLRRSESPPERRP